MNYTTIAGHLGTDPEVRYTSSGKKVTNLRVAVKARKDETIWWRVTIWGEQFDKMISFLKKGSAVVVMGEILKPEIYQDREGNSRVSLELVAHNLTFSPFGKGNRNDGQSQEGSQEQQYAPSNSSGFEAPAFENSFGGSTSSSDDEIPF